MHLRLFAATLAAACSTETRTVVVPSTVAVEDACGAYGYVPGTDAYRICAEREAAARRRGRMAAGYAEARIAGDAQEACLSYGLVTGTERFDSCMRREISYRRP
ncbi:MAG TPA: hypothetical protein VLA02_06645 [Reyranella sp.]|nr:hypothetical protein [Reyranella sp.]